MSLMNSDWQERRIREFFQRQKEKDQRTIPPFDKMWDAAHGRSTKFSDRWHMLQFAFVSMILIIIVGTTLFALRERLETPAAARITSIADWHSPTDVLLEIPGQNIFKAIPRLGKPYSISQSNTTEEL